MAKWKRPTNFSPVAPARTLYRAKNGTANKKKTATQVRKEAVLRRSLELVKESRKNENAVSTIVQKAMKADLPDLAMEAVRAFSPKSNSDFCWTMGFILKTENWNYFDKDFLHYCVERLLVTTECRGGWIFGDHQADMRSSALGKAGLYFLLRGDVDHAFALWEEATDGYDIDEVISETALKIVEGRPKLYETSLGLTDFINNESKRAETLTELSYYA